MVEKNKKIMINIGCGPTGHGDWINLDWGILAFLHRFLWLEKLIFKLGLWPGDQNEINYNVKWPKNLRLVNCAKPLKFPKNSVDYIYSSHFFEHIKKFQTIAVLKSCYRCLKPGGVIRVSIPDLDFIVEQYKNNNDNIKKVDIINDHIYALGEQKLTPPGFYQKIQNFFMRGHQWIYNYDYFKEMLVKSGFKEASIARCRPREGKVPNLDALDCHEDESIFLEAVK